VASLIYRVATLIIFSPLIVVKPIYLKKNIIFLDSIVEIYKHWNTVETLVSYSGTKSLVAEWCRVLLSIEDVKICLRKYHVFCKGTNGLLLYT
jgi:hypothetical protein